MNLAGAREGVKGGCRVGRDQKHDCGPKAIQKDFETQRGSLSSRLTLFIHFRGKRNPNTHYMRATQKAMV